MYQPSKSQKSYYTSNSWLGDRRTIENSKYTSFRFSTYKNYNAGVAVIGVSAANMLDQLQVFVFAFLLVKL